MHASGSDGQTLDLTPFWKSGNAFHRSTDQPVREFVKFAATYPEFVGLEKFSDAEKQAKIQAIVDALYDPTNRRRGLAVRPTVALAAVSGGTPAAPAQAAAAPTKAAATSAHGVAAPAHGVAAPAHAQAVLKAAPVPQAAAPTPQAAVSVQAAPGAPAGAAHAPAPEALTALQRLDWFIRIRVKKFQLGQSFTVLFFLGSVPEHVDQWRLSPHLIGSYSEFVNSDPEHCANCRDSASIITEGFIDLDDSLERLGFAHKSEQEIETHLQHELHWRIQKVSHHHPLHLTRG